MVQQKSTEYSFDTFKSLEGKLDQEETKIHIFLKDQYPKLADIFKNFIVKGRKGILNRLVGALIREDILGLAMSSYDLQDMDMIDGLSMEELDAFGLDKRKNYKVYPLYDKEHLVIPVSSFYAFRRVEIIGDILHISGDKIKKIEHAVELLAFLSQKEKRIKGNIQSQWGKLADELRNGCANLALSYTYWEDKQKKLQQQASKCGAQNLIEYVLLRKQKDETFDSALFFEQLTIEGHNLHPGTKTKMGINSQDVYLYSPEFEGKPDIHLVGIRREYAEWSLIDGNNDANSILFADYPSLRDIITLEFQKKDLTIDEFVFVPVHPWQMINTIPSIYHKELEDQMIVPVDSIRIPSGATSSFRTVVPFADKKGKKLCLKLAVHSQMTSTIRSLSTNTTNNAPKFTRLIREIMKRETELARIFIPVCELAGYNFKVSNEEPSRNHTLKSRNLSAVLRENVESFIVKDELAIVASSLYVKSPTTDKPILVELIEIYAKSIGEGSPRKAAFQFLSEYANIAISGYLTLMVKYGIGLEGHMQNSIPVFKNGRPVKMLFRDWGGVRILHKRISTCGIITNFTPNSITITDNIQEMHNKVFYTLFQNHFGEIIIQVIKYYGLKERELWEEIIRLCDKLFHSLESRVEFMENVWLDREALYQIEVHHKALIRMRLSSGNKEYTYSKVPNPLYKYQTNKSSHKDGEGLVTSN